MKETISASARKAHIRTLTRYLSNPRDALTISLGREWPRKFTTGPGVYAVFRGRKVIYVGESGGLRARMRDLRRTVNHTLRRQLGAAQFGHHPAFHPATASTKFPPEIEKLLNRYVTRYLRIKAAAVSLGRKEVEEQLIEDLAPRFNLKTRRGDLLELVPES